MTKYIFLTFDVEEFDLPVEYGQQMSMQQQMAIGYAGLQSIMPILEHENIKTTLFTTANFANQFSEEIKKLSFKHEIASHTYYHSRFKKEDLQASRLALEQITGKQVMGLRMPRMKAIDMDWVKEAGYFYDSSINPCYLPGKYNNTHLPKTVYQEKTVTRIPATVTPNLRLPLFWLAFKNLPYPIFKIMLRKSLDTYGYANLYFHPWEFTDISSSKIPFYTKTGCKGKLLQKLQCLINDFKNEAEFVSIESYLHKNNLR